MAGTFRQLKADVESTQREMDRLRGSVDELLGRLRQDHKVTRVGDARKLRSKLKRQRDALQKKMSKALKEFQSEWELDQENSDDGQ